MHVSLLTPRAYKSLKVFLGKKTMGASTFMEGRERNYVETEEEIRSRSDQTGSNSDMMEQQRNVKREVVDKEEDRREEEDKFEILLSTLELRLPSRSSGDLRVEKTEEEDRPDGFKTPTSSEPAAVLQCPPAPRKPKSFPSMKRKAVSGRPTLMPHFFVELESLFPPLLVGGKVKKAKRSAE